MVISHKDALLMGHDADQRWLSPVFFQDLLTAYRETEYPLAGVLPKVTHNDLPPHLPNINSAIRWFEDDAIMKLTNDYFEPGPAFGAPQYRAVDGYNPSSRLAETHTLLGDIDVSSLTNAKDRLYVPEVQLTLSPRRLVKKITSGKLLNEIWEDVDDFRATHDYRAQDEAYEGLQDIPRGYHDDLLWYFGHNVLIRAETALQKDATISDPRSYALCELEKIRTRLQGPADMFTD